MKHTPSPLVSAVRQALFAGGALALSTQIPTAIAQNAGENLVEEVVVTGSRLRRDRDFLDVSPVQTMDMEQIRMSGNVTLENTLNRLPQLVPDNTSSTNNTGGSGVLSANLRGLGATRTLVLVDGRRFMPADVTGLVDLATIPDMLIERVEVVTGGASAVYGSDAVAGAVNFLLRDDFEGMELRYQYGETQRGDGETDKLDFIMGAVTDDGRGKVTLAGSYTKRDLIRLDARSFSRQPLIPNAAGEFQPFGSGNIPGGLIGLSPAQFPQIQGVDLSNADGSCGSSIQGVRFGANSNPAPFCRISDQFNYAADNFMQRPLERFQITGLGSFQLNDRVEAYGQLFYTKKENAFQQAPEAVSPTSFGQENGTVLIPNADTNPLFSDPLRAFFSDNRDFFDPDGDGVYTVRNTGRRFLEFGSRTVTYETDSFMMTGGFRGDFEFADNTWSWDTFYQYSRVDEARTNSGLLSRSRLTLGLDAVVVDGQPECRLQLLGCVPVNIFGTDALTPEMSNFLQVDARTKEQFTRQVAGASIAGTLFELPSGPVATAFGVEWRKEEFSSTPDSVQLSGDLVSQAVAPTINSGDFDIFEVFAEARIPLLNDLPAIKSLALEGAVRHADYSTIGTATAWSGSLDWEVNDWVRARAGLSRAIRAPNLNELYSAIRSGFVGGADPCLADRNPTDAQKSLCVQQGVPQEFVDSLQVGASQGFQVVTGGNLDLSEETSDTLTAGLVLMPPSLPGLSLSLDYYSVEVDDAIDLVSGQVLVNTCFDSLDASGLACQSIRRLSSGNIDTVNAPLLNVAKRKVDGMDLQIGYSFDDLPQYLSLPNHGATLDLSLVSSWQFTNETQPLAGQPTIDCAGFYGGSCSSGTVRINPDHRALLRANWRSGPLRITPELRFIGALELAEDALANPNGDQGSVYYVDLTAGYDVTDTIQIYGGINNALDRDPPIFGYRDGGNTNTNVQLFDPIGRTFFLGATMAFGG
ncbi:MAG: TonB-dependent receptor domain-containing protein [Chromatocurvus sp.]